MPWRLHTILYWVCLGISGRWRLLKTFIQLCTLTQTVTETLTFKGAKAGWFAWTDTLSCLCDYGLPAVVNFTGRGIKAIFKVISLQLCQLDTHGKRFTTVCNCNDDLESSPRATFRYCSVGDLPANQHNSGSAKGGKTTWLRLCWDLRCQRSVQLCCEWQNSHKCYLHN